MRSSLNTWFGYAGLLMYAPLREGWGRRRLPIPTDAPRRGPWSRWRGRGLGKRIDLGDGTIGTGGAFWPRPPKATHCWRLVPSGRGRPATLLGVATPWLLRSRRAGRRSRAGRRIDPSRNTG